MVAANDKRRKKFKKLKRKKMDAPNVRTKMYNKKTRKFKSYPKETGAPGVEGKAPKKAKTGAPNSPIVVCPSDPISTGSAVSSIDKTPKKSKKKKQELQTFPKGEPTTWKDNGKAKTTAPSPPIDVLPPDPFLTGCAESASEKKPKKSKKKKQELQTFPKGTLPSRKNRKFVQEIARKTIDAAKVWIDENHSIVNTEHVSTPEIMEKLYSKYRENIPCSMSPPNEAAYELLPDPSEEWFRNWHLAQETLIKLSLLQPEEIQDFTGENLNYIEEGLLDRRLMGPFNVCLYRTILNFVQLKCADLELENKRRAIDVDPKNKNEAESEITKLFENRSYIKKGNLYSRKIPADATSEDEVKILREKILFLSLSVTEQAKALVPMIDMDDAYKVLNAESFEEFDTEQLMEKLRTILKTRSRMEIFCAKILNDKDLAENWRRSEPEQRDRMNTIISNWLKLDELGRILFLMLDWFSYYKKYKDFKMNTRNDWEKQWKNRWKVDIGTLPFFGCATEEIVYEDLKTFSVVDRLRQLVTKDPEEFSRVLNFVGIRDTFLHDPFCWNSYDCEYLACGWKKFVRTVELTKDEQRLFVEKYFKVDIEDFNLFLEDENSRCFKMYQSDRDNIHSELQSFLTLLRQRRKMRVILSFFKGKSLRVPKYLIASKQIFLEYLDSSHSAIPDVQEVINQLDKSNITDHIKDKWLKCSKKVLEAAKNKEWHELETERGSILRAYNFLNLSENDKRQVLEYVDEDPEDGTNGTKRRNLEAWSFGERWRHKREKSIIQCAGIMKVPYINVYKCAEDNKLLYPSFQIDN